MVNRQIHGHNVRYEEHDLGAEEAVRFLEIHSSREEADVFFHQAKERGTAQFEDRHGKNFTLIHHMDGYYTIEPRSY